MISEVRAAGHAKATQRPSSHLMLAAVANFSALVVVGVVLMIGARGMAEQADREVLLHVGSALLGGGLSFFLVTVFALSRETGGRQ